MTGSEKQDRVPVPRDERDIRDRALDALRSGRFAETERLLRDGDLGLAELTHELVVHQTELEMQAEELRETGRREMLAREHAQQLFSALPVPALTVESTSGEVLQANAAATASFRVTGPSAESHALFRRLGEDAGQQDALAQAVVQAAAQGTAEMTEVALRQRDGRTMRGRVRLERIAGVDDGPPRLLAVIVDETAQREALARLDTSEKRFREIAESVSDVFFMTEGPGKKRTVYVSDGAARLWGFDPSDGLPQGFNPLATSVLKADRLALDEAVDAMDSNELAVDFRIGRPDGTVRWLSCKARLASDGERLIGTLRDITDARRNEQRMQWLERHARCQARILELANAPRTPDATLIPEIIATIVASMRADQHPAVRIVLGEDEYLSEDWRAPPNPLRAPLRIRGHDEGLIEAGHAQPRCERPCAPDSPTCACRLLSGAYAVEDRESFDQISRLVVRILENRAMSDQLAQAERLATIGKLAGGFAHDFNNLLTVIVGQAETLSEAPDLAAPRRKSADSILNAALRASDLTGYLLSYARRQPLAPETITIERLLDELQPIASRVLGPNITIATRIGAGDLALEADAALLFNALRNLLLNARDAMPDGGRVTFSAHLNDPENPACGRPGCIDGVCLVIEDTGIGMSPEVLARAEEPFFTTKPPGKGSGLGLSMVSGFTQQSGGCLSMSSEPGEGTRVTLCLPRARNAP